MLIQKHEGRGKPIVIRKGLRHTVSTVDASQWCSDSRELPGIRLEKPDQIHKSLVLVNTYIHPGAASTKANLDFLEQFEDEAKDTVVMCSDFNARSGMWDQQGNKPQGKALEEALGDVIFTPVTTPLPTHLGSRHGDTDSTTDLALVSPRMHMAKCRNADTTWK